MGDSPTTACGLAFHPFVSSARFVEVDRLGKRADGKAEEAAGLSHGNDDNSVSSPFHADQPCFPLSSDGTFCFFLDSDRPRWSMALERSYSEFGETLDMRRNFQRQREEANGCSVLRKFFDFVTEPGGVVMDLASGPSGYFAPALDQLKADGIFIAADACPTVLSSLADASNDERFFLFDLDLDQPLPLRDKSVDVFSGNLLSNVNRYPDLLREVFRCLKPSGRLAVIELFFEEGSATAEFLTQRQAIFSSFETYVDFCESVGFEYLGGDLLRETTGKMDPGDLLPIAPEDRLLTRTVFFQK